MNFILHYFNFCCKTKLDPTECYFIILLKNVLYWPEDDRLRSKHVVVM